MHTTVYIYILFYKPNSMNSDYMLKLIKAGDIRISKKNARINGIFLHTTK